METEYSKHLIYGNYRSMPGQDFPMDCETLAALQNNIQKLAVIASVAGCDRLVLTGCEVQGNVRSGGYVFVRGADNPDTGEILYHPQQPTSDYCRITETHEHVTANTIEYREAYTQRHLASGEGNGAMLWSSFKTLGEMSNLVIHNKLNTFIQNINAALEKKQPQFTIKTAKFDYFDGTTFAGKIILNCYVVAWGIYAWLYTLAVQNGNTLTLYGARNDSYVLETKTLNGDTTSRNAWGVNHELAYAYFTYLEYV